MIPRNISFLLKLVINERTTFGCLKKCYSTTRCSLHERCWQTCCFCSGICWDICEGVTTDEIDKAVHKMIISAGTYPSPLGYKGFPKSICTSVNECAFHGIPDFRPLEDGDIINIDVTVFLNVTEECLQRAIAVCGPGVEIKELGKIVIGHAGKYGYGVDKSYSGHGVGKQFHSAPVINFYDDQPGCMMVGQTFALEPLLTLGDTDYDRWDDNWTVVTADGSLSAQFEHTLLITESGVEILTQQS